MVAGFIPNEAGAELKLNGAVVEVEGPPKLNDGTEGGAAPKLKLGLESVVLAEGNVKAGLAEASAAVLVDVVAAVGMEKAGRENDGADAAGAGNENAGIVGALVEDGGFDSLVTLNEKLEEGAELALVANSNAAEAGFLASSDGFTLNEKLPVGSIGFEVEIEAEVEVEVIDVEPFASL